ncbi:MAG: sensor histidine kinase [Acetobacteraceae bacterium]
MDHKTLVWATVTTLPLFSVVLLAIWSLDRRLISLPVLAAGLAVHTVAALLFALRGAMPIAWTIVGANSVALLGYGVIWAAMRIAEGRRPAILLHAVPALIWLLACAVPLFYETFPARVALVSALIAVIDLAIVREFARPVADLPSRRLAVLLFGLHAAIHVLRTILAVVAGAGVIATAQGGAEAELRRALDLAVYGLALVHPVAMCLVLVTIAKERAEVQLRQAERWRGLLMRELNHRVKNALATVLSLMHQTVRQSQGDVVAFRNSFEDRIMALGRAHDLLQRQNWDAMRAREAAEAALSPWFGLGQVSIEGDPDIRLRPELGQMVVLALHELATNAVKFGAMSTRDGRVSVVLSRMRRAADEPALSLLWQERGGPPIAAPPVARGFGRRLLEQGLVHQSGGAVDMDFHPAGLSVRLQLPLDEHAPVPVEMALAAVR